MKRSKVIPKPQGVPERVLAPLVLRLRDAIDFAEDHDEVERTREAEELWSRVYPSLSEGKPGLLGAILGRAEAQVMRLACIYALMNCSRKIQSRHLQAALALWEFSAASASRIFGTSVGDRTADRILDRLRDQGELSETDVHAIFDNHKSKTEIDRAFDRLQQCGLVTFVEEKTGGRPRAVWRLATPGGGEK